MDFPHRYRVIQQWEPYEGAPDAVLVERIECEQPMGPSRGFTDDGRRCGNCGRLRAWNDLAFYRGRRYCNDDCLEEVSDGNS